MSIDSWRGLNAQYITLSIFAYSILLDCPDVHNQKCISYYTFLESHDSWVVFDLKLSNPGTLGKCNMSCTSLQLKQGNRASEIP